jgi:hypothetical protein
VHSRSPKRVALHHLNDLCKLPCWIGITPGVTMTYEQAQAIVRNVYGDPCLLLWLVGVKRFLYC